MTGARRPHCIRPPLTRGPRAQAARLCAGAGAGAATTMLNRSAAAAVGDRVVARLTYRLRAYLTVRAAAGPDSPATQLAARALERACEDAVAFEQDGLAPPPGRRRRRE